MKPACRTREVVAQSLYIDINYNSGSSDWIVSYHLFIYLYNCARIWYILWTFSWTCIFSVL